MQLTQRMRLYQQQAVASSTPELLIAKLYDLGVSSCHRQDRAKLRAVLVELIASLDFERGGEIAERLHMIYEFCMYESSAGDLQVVCTLLTGLRDAWREGILSRKAA